MPQLKRPSVAPVFIAGIALLALALAFTQPRSATLSQESCRPSNLSAANWRTDFCRSQVDFSEILVGHPMKDGIPSVTDPVMESLEAASAWLSERSPVIAIEINGEARAYPLAILMWHEIANDEIAGRAGCRHFLPALQQLDRL